MTMLAFTRAHISLTLGTPSCLQSMCDCVADKFVELEPLLLAVDLALLRTPAWRHLLLNRSRFKADIWYCWNAALYCGLLPLCLLFMCAFADPPVSPVLDAPSVWLAWMRGLQWLSAGKDKGYEIVGDVQHGHTHSSIQRLLACILASFEGSAQCPATPDLTVEAMRESLHMALVIITGLGTSTFLLHIYVKQRSGGFLPLLYAQLLGWMCLVPVHALTWSWHQGPRGAWLPWLVGWIGATVASHALITSYPLADETSVERIAHRRGDGNVQTPGGNGHAAYLAAAMCAVLPLLIQCRHALYVPF